MTTQSTEQSEQSNQHESADSKHGLEAIRQGRIEKAEQLRAAGHNPYPYHFDKTASADELQKKYAELESGVETEDSYQVAGRIMAMRNSGMFLDLEDESGKLQVFCHKDSLAEADQPLLKLLDVGDIVGATGTIRRTPRGELSLRTKHLEVLCKSLLPLPEKYHGLTDVEARYRQRYLDLIMNEDTRQTLRQRSLIVSGIRRFFEARGFLEVETPILQTQAGGAAAKPFMTHHNALDLELSLRIAPELYLKRLVVGGLAERVFELNRNFRNEGISVKHNPEFTMMEAYQAYADYNDMMSLLESLVASLCQQVFGTTELTFQGQQISYKTPWKRITMADAVKEKCGVDFMTLKSGDEAYQALTKLGYGDRVDSKESWGKQLLFLFEELVEPSLIQPTHVIDFPKEVSPLAKTHRNDERLVERFEAFVNGWEIANAFSELSDPIDQRQRFEHQLAERAKGDDEAHLLDEDYITALEYGLPPTGGLGVGIDRLVMLLTDKHNIRDVIAFPTMRPRH